MTEIYNFDENNFDDNYVTEIYNFDGENVYKFFFARCSWHDWIQLYFSMAVAPKKLKNLLDSVSHLDAT